MRPREWCTYGWQRFSYAFLSFSGRNPEVRQDLVAEFKQLAVGLGIPEDSIVRLVNKGKPGVGGVGQD